MPRPLDIADEWDLGITVVYQKLEKTDMASHDDEKTMFVDRMIKLCICAVPRP